MSSQVLKTASGQPYIALETKSTTPIYLTTFYPSDIEALPEIMSLAEISRELIAIPQPYTRANAEWWINHQLSGKSNLALQVLRASDPELGTMIGAVSLEPKDSEALHAVEENLVTGKLKMSMKKNECALGYYLHPGWQGNRIMVPAVKALLRWAKEQVGVENVVVQILEENVRSRAVISSLGGMFVRSEKDDNWVDWPEQKGGGRRNLMVWRWTGKLE